MNKQTLTFGLALVVVCGLALAQERRDLPTGNRSAAGRPADTSTSTVSPPRAVMPSPSRTSTTVSPVRDSVGASSPEAGYVSVPVQSYGWYDAYGYGRVDWIGFNMFLERLRWQYALNNVHELAWRYAQGDTFLTPQVVDLALRNSAGATAMLRHHAQRLQHLIAAYERGEIDRATFSASGREAAKEIRRLAGRIRKDPLLDYLDIQADAALPQYDTPSSMRNLALLADELASTVAQMDGNLKSMINADANRVIGVDSLQQPSFEALSKRIDRMARVIEKSVTKL